MTGSPNSFLIPREQFLAWRHLTFWGASRRQELEGAETQGYSFFWARNALFHALQALDVPASAHILVPAYICKAAVEPFEAYGACVEFYGIRRDCTVDLDELEAKIRPETKVILAVHYFGFPGPIHELRDLCDRRGLLLFEDCAHVLRGRVDSQSLGSFGDASVFSYRKFLPMFDGAELRLRGAKAPKSGSYRPERSLFWMRAAKHIAGQALEWSTGSFAKALSHANRMLRGQYASAEAPSAPALTTQESVDNNSASFDPALVQQPVTGPSRWVLRHSNFGVVAGRRRENYQFLDGQLRNVAGVTPLFSTLSEGVCPWVYPLFLDDVPDAHLLLRAAGIPAVTWGGVRPNRVTKEDFPAADFLYENLLFLPVHQNLSREQLITMAERVKKVRTETLQFSPERVPVAS